MLTSSKQVINMKRTITLFVLALFLCISSSSAQNPAQPRRTISQFTEKMQKIDGFQPLYLIPDDGKIYLEISRWNKEFLHLASLPTGVGSNDIGLDRSQLGSTKVVF